MRQMTMSALVLAAALAVAPALAASAVTSDNPPADKVTWSVTPANLQGPDGRLAFAYAVNPGTLIHDFVAITNKGAAAATFATYAADAETDADTGDFAVKTAKETKSDLGGWITMYSTSVLVQPGETVIMPFTLSVATNASPGDHAAGIVASITTKSTAPGKHGTSVLLEQRVAATVYLRVSGAVHSGVQTSGFVISYAPSLNPFGSGDASLSYDVKNTGNVRENVNQKLTVSAPFGVQLSVVGSAKTVKNLLPGQSVHQRFVLHGVPAVVLLFANSVLTPAAPTDVIPFSNERGADGGASPTRTAVQYEAVSSQTFTGAINWILLLIIVVVAALIYLFVRYLRGARERMYEAIDLAAEEAREAALEEAGARGPGSRS